MKAFRSPKTTLGDLDADAAAALIAGAVDIAFILDAAGVIRDVAITAPDLEEDLQGHARWLGKRLTDTVTEESRSKAEALIADASSKQEPRWRHLNHPATSGADVPILYAAVQTGTPGRIVVFGRNLRTVSTLQRRLVDAQQSMERDYARIRHVETRYRLLFEMAPDAVLIVDGGSQRILDSNPSGQAHVRGPAGAHIRWASRPSVHAMIRRGRWNSCWQACWRQAGRTMSGRDWRRTTGRLWYRPRCFVTTTVFPAWCASPQRRLSRTATVVNKLQTKLLKLMESAPDAFVVTGLDGRVMTANASFLQLTQMPNEERAQGESLDRWLGRTGVDLDVLRANLRQHGSIRLFATVLRGELGEQLDVEVSAVTVMNGGQPCFGFTIRDVEPAPAARAAARTGGCRRHSTI